MIFWGVSIAVPVVFERYKQAGTKSSASPPVPGRNSSRNMKFLANTFWLVSINSW